MAKNTAILFLGHTIQPKCCVPKVAMVQDRVVGGWSLVCLQRELTGNLHMLCHTTLSIDKINLKFMIYSHLHVGPNLQLNNKL